MTKKIQAYIDELEEYIDSHKYRFNNCQNLKELKEVLYLIIDEIVY